MQSPADAERPADAETAADGAARLRARRRVVGIGLGLIVLGVLGFLGAYDAMRERDDLSLADQPVLEWMAAHRSPLLTDLFTLVAKLFGPVILPILVAIGCAFWGWRSGRWRDPLILVVAMLASTAVSVVVKALVARPRPSDEFMTVPGVESSFSFPSGHTIGATTLVLVTAYLMWTRRPTRRLLLLWITISVVVILVVAVSRLYLGYHFVTDVVAAVCLAVAVLGGVVALDPRVTGPQPGHTSGVAVRAP